MAIELQIQNFVINKFNKVEIDLKYDSVADTFAFDTTFDQNDKANKFCFKPLSYYDCTIKYRGVLVMTGTLLNHSFTDMPAPTPTSISGYSKCGVIGDCTIANYPVQSNLKTIKEIAEFVCTPYEVKVIIDPEVADVCNKPIQQSTVDQFGTILSYLDSLCSQRFVVLSHDNKGNLLLTKAKVGKILTTVDTLVRDKPTAFVNDIEGSPDFINKYEKEELLGDRAILWDFNPNQKGKKYISMALTTNGQAMHSPITISGQGGQISSADNYIVNPYVSTKTTYDIISGASKTFTTELIGSPTPTQQHYLKQDVWKPLRAKNVQQTFGDGTTIPLTARFELGKELKAIGLTITVKGWTLGGNLITPNQVITVYNPACYIYKKTTFFITDVKLVGTEQPETAVIKCVLPECFTQDEVKNIFNVS